MTQPAAGSRFGGPPAEPAPPLRALLDVPLRFQLSPDEAEALQALAAEVRRTPPDADWAQRYARAIEIAEAIVKTTDARLEELQRRALATEDPNETRQRLSQGPRREAERGRSEAKAAAQKAAKEWLDRSRRQLDHVLGQCVEAAQKLLASREEEGAHGIVLRGDEASYARLSGHVGRCADEWSKSVVGGAEKSLSEGVAGSVAAVVPLAGRGPKAPPPPEAPANEVRLGGELPTKDAEVPSTASSLLAYVRTNIMAVGMFGTVIGAVIYLAGMLGGSGGAQRQGLSSMLLRGGLILAVLPVTLVLGLRAAKTQRAAQREKALAAHRQAMQQLSKGEIERALEKHRRALERWIAARAETWTQAVDAWWTEAVEPRLAEADTRATETARELRMQQSKLGEEQTALKTFRSQLSQNLMFDLKKRLRELEESKQGAP